MFANVAKYPWHDLLAPANVPNWVLAAIGLCGVTAAVKTLRAIQRQITVEEESLRPRLTIGVALQAGSENPYAQLVREGRAVYSLEIINTGGIPAYQVIPETWLEWLERPFKFTSAAHYHKGQPLSVYPTKSTLYRVPFDTTLSQNQIAALRSGRASVCLRVRLTYKAFKATVHTEQALVTEPTCMSFLPEHSSAT